MKDWRLDLATLALFTCVGPFLGTLLLSVEHDGWSGFLMPLFLAVFLAFAGQAGIAPFLGLFALPAFLSAAAGIAVRRSGHPALFIPATMIGGCVANLAAQQLMIGEPPSRYWVLTGLITSFLLALLDVALRRRESRKLQVA